MRPLISVVMAYHNRKSLLLQTLKSIAPCPYAPLTEIIIVDDGSSPEHRLDNINEELKDLIGKTLNIKVIRVEPEDKWYSNPCIPYNMGFKEATGDVIIIQNPECYHLGDILTVASQVRYNQYISFHCFSLDKETTNILPELNPLSLLERGLAFTPLHEELGTPFGAWLSDLIPFWPLPEMAIREEGGIGYYNHAVHRPYAYHFCSAISRLDLEELGGFDERYAEGFAYDDNELITRIMRKGMELAYCQYPMVLHQNHYKESKEYEVWDNQKLENKDKLARNHNLFQNVTSQETGWRANV